MLRAEKRESIATSSNAATENFLLKMAATKAQQKKRIVQAIASVFP